MRIVPRNGWRLLAALAVATALWGCTSPAERKAADEKKCESNGFKPGSDEFSKCMMAIDTNREKVRDQDMNAVQMQQNIMMAPNCPTGMCW